MISQKFLNTFCNHLPFLISFADYCRFPPKFIKKSIHQKQFYQDVITRFEWPLISYVIKGPLLLRSIKILGNILKVTRTLIHLFSFHNRLSIFVNFIFWRVKCVFSINILFESVWDFKFVDFFSQLFTLLDNFFCQHSFLPILN